MQWSLLGRSAVRICNNCAIFWRGCLHHYLFHVSFFLCRISSFPINLSEIKYFPLRNICVLDRGNLFDAYVPLFYTHNLINGSHYRFKCHQPVVQSCLKQTRTAGAIFHSVTWWFEDLVQPRDQSLTANRPTACPLYLVTWPIVFQHRVRGAVGVRELCLSFRDLSTFYSFML
jgi:hypothetical protein